MDTWRDTLSETKMAPENGWKTTFIFRNPIFRVGYVGFREGMMFVCVFFSGREGGISLFATQVVLSLDFFYPENWGNDPVWRAYCSDGLKPPTSNLIQQSIWFEHSDIASWMLQWYFLTAGNILLVFWYFGHLLTDPKSKNRRRWIMSSSTETINSSFQTLFFAGVLMGVFVYGGKFTSLWRDLK